MIDRGKIQSKAVEMWEKANKRGTLEMATGTGKTIAALLCLYTMPKNRKIHIFLAETNQREADLMADIEKFNSLFGKNVMKDYNLVFKCYQGVYDLENYEFGLVIADEIHMGLTPTYSKFFYNNKYDAIVGLSATVERATSYDIGEGIKITKGEYLDEIAPVCFRYSMKKAVDDNIGRVIDVYLLGLTLNSTIKNVKAGSKLKPFYQTQKSQYEYLNKSFKQSFFCRVKSEDERQIIIRNRWKWRADFIGGLVERLNNTKYIVNNIKGKSVLFGNNIDNLLAITPNVVNSKNTAEENDLIRKNFDEGLIETIGSYRMLRQGANLVDVDNCVLLSFYGLETHIVQQVGRLRKNGDKKGALVIVYYKDTYEEDDLVKILNFIKYDKLYNFEDSKQLINFINGVSENDRENCE